MAPTLLAIVLTMSASALYADTGERFLSVTCNASSLTVEPFVAWNEDADNYSEAQKNGRSKDGDTTVFYFSKRYNDAARTTCTVGRRTFQIAVLQGELELKEGTTVLMRKIIDDVWDIYGPVYKVRYTSNRWDEYCGHVERNPTWKAARFKDSYTNCR